MDSKKYLKQSARTAASNYTAIGNRMSPPTIGSYKDEDVQKAHREKQEIIDLQHAALGMITESAEFADMLKKHLFYGKPLDKVNLAEEIGDQLWYCAMALRALGTDFETVMERNIAKLKARYPEKFTEERAENRDLVTERKILEDRSERLSIKIPIMQFTASSSSSIEEYIDWNYSGYELTDLERNDGDGYLLLVLEKKAVNYHE